MAYTTPSHVRQYIPLIDEQAMSDTEMEKFIARSEAVIDGTLGEVYVVPFNSPAPQLIKEVTAEYTAYLVYRTIMSQNSPNSSDYVEELKASAESMLTKLIEGKLSVKAQRNDDLAYSIKDDKSYFSMQDITPRVSRDYYG